MAFDNSKYDVEIAGVGYRIDNYRKSEAEAFIPRLGSGTQSESEFDLLRSRSIEDFSGGMLQRAWKDDHAYFGSENLYPIYGDAVLYPVPTLSPSTAITTNKSNVTATCVTDKYFFVAVVTFNTPTTTLYRIDKSGTKTAMTLPASLSSRTISSMVVWKNQLWIACYGNYSMWYMDLGGTSAAEVTGGPTPAGLQRLAVYQGQLYGTAGDVTDMNAVLYKYAGDTTTKAFTNVGDTGFRYNDNSVYSSLFVFNGRLYLTRSEGMWAYDGIRLAPIDDNVKNADPNNYRYPTVLKGYLYYFMSDGFYRFNGSMIEKLYDVSEVGFPVDVCNGKNRLWLVYRNSADSGSSRYDKSMGYNYSTGTVQNGRVACYDGKAMFTYARTTNEGKPALPDVNNQGENSGIAWFNDQIYVFTYYTKNTPGLHFQQSTNELANTGSISWRLITSIFDADFAMIDKNIDNIELVIDGDAPADETINIEYRVTGFSDDSGWTTLGTIKTQSKLKEYVYSQIPAGLKFKKIQFRFTATTTAGYGLKKLIFRYLLVPDMKWQWNFTVNAFGDNPIEPLMLKDGKPSSQAVSSLRGTVYDSRITGIPIPYTDIDQFDLNGAHNNSVTTITLNSTAMLKNAGFVKIDDEVIRYTGKTATTLTGCTRGQLGTVAASHADNAAVFAHYRVLVRKIQQERIEMDDSDLDRQEDKSKPSQIALIFQEV
jgi:hypothetical protein